MVSSVKSEGRSGMPGAEPCSHPFPLIGGDGDEFTPRLRLRSKCASEIPSRASSAGRGCAAGGGGSRPGSARPAMAAAQALGAVRQGPRWRPRRVRPRCSKSTPKARRSTNARPTRKAASPGSCASRSPASFSTARRSATTMPVHDGSFRTAVRSRARSSASRRAMAPPTSLAQTRRHRRRWSRGGRRRHDDFQAHQYARRRPRRRLRARGRASERGLLGGLRVPEEMIGFIADRVERRSSARQFCSAAFDCPRLLRKAISRRFPLLR